ncbi:hypothetical protein BV20DRAFT_836676 [Pilatotrama ljubarskyi]|nr:hypothetical protein BV20DRAFT_836676 [Pilatotrama ljubarskyi]
MLASAAGSPTLDRARRLSVPSESTAAAASIPFETSEWASCMSENLYYPPLTFLRPAQTDCPLLLLLLHRWSSCKLIGKPRCSRSCSSPCRLNCLTARLSNSRTGTGESQSRSGVSW